MLLHHLSGECIKFRLRLVERDAFAQTRNGMLSVITPVAIRLRVFAWKPDIDSRRDVRVSAHIHSKTAWKHSDNGRGEIVHVDRFSDNVRILVISALPEIVADQQMLDMHVPDIFLRVQATAKQRLNAESR